MAAAAVSYVLLSFLFLLLGAVVAAVLGYYGNYKTQPKYVHIACFIAFFFAASIILVLPLDLASTRYRLCLERATNGTLEDCNEPTINVSSGFLYVFWKLTYWTTFILSMFIVPVMQGYVRSGAFNFRGRLWDGIKDNLQFYGISGGFGLILLLYAIFGLRIPPADLMTLAIPAANAYGLVYLILYLSYGLVELPRGIWYHANVKWLLRYMEVQAPILKEAVVDSESDAYEIAREVAHASRIVPNGDPLRPLVDTITERCPISLQSRGLNDNGEGLPDTYTRPILKGLNRRIGRVNFLHQRDQAMFKNLLNKAFLYQDILDNYNNQTKRFNSMFLTVQDGPYKDHFLQAYWWWYVWLKPISMRSVSILCAIASFLILWSESTFQVTSVRLSIPAMLLSPGAIDHLALEWLGTLFICYVCACTYSTILSLKIFDIYRVVPDHHTDEPTLLFVALNLCRLTFPLCYNFLNMAGLADGKKGKTDGSVDYSDSPIFIQYLGPAVNLTPLLGSRYNDWMPYSIFVMSVIFFFNFHSRLLRLFKLKNFAYEDIKADGTDSEEGRQIISQARSIEERRVQRGGNDRSGASATGGAAPQARNTQELLAKYRSKRTNDTSLEVLNAGFPPSNTRKTAAPSSTTTQANTTSRAADPAPTSSSGGFLKALGDYLPRPGKSVSTSRQGFQRLTGSDDIEANLSENTDVFGGDVERDTTTSSWTTNGAGPGASSSSNRKFGLPPSQQQQPNPPASSALFGRSGASTQKPSAFKGGKNIFDDA